MRTKKRRASRKITKKTIDNDREWRATKAVARLFLQNAERKSRKNKKKIKKKNIFQKGLDKRVLIWYNNKVAGAGMAQSVEHVIGNDEVISSILITSSKKQATQKGCLFFYPIRRIGISLTHEVRRDLAAKQERIFA